MLVQIVLTWFQRFHLIKYTFQKSTTPLLQQTIESNFLFSGTFTRSVTKTEPVRKIKADKARVNDSPLRMKFAKTKHAPTPEPQNNIKKKGFNITRLISVIVSAACLAGISAKVFIIVLEKMKYMPAIRPKLVTVSIFRTLCSSTINYS